MSKVVEWNDPYARVDMAEMWISNKWYCGGGAPASGTSTTTTQQQQHQALLARSPTLMDNVPAFGNSVHGGTTVRSMYDWLGHGLVSMEDVGLQRDMARPKGGSLLPLFGCGQAPQDAL
ncbi:hypothetical protein NEUTE1DRAFT_106968 [Neurospora tetrasperma FGSC 2508]|uniref:Uncharacterized protein n=1 Tax=Neurospora tetrasperma (strain FGSC 2508 / ATCC MYA-4615 / P0657) TaxID=510951 RepID=F8MBR8_NEUT8|nr:uncharacterized protein NEUTE1DRAFT_106968 [Neurospora tetrasperma FGSC 2508]EGO60326.1 hypothetical protein NEUTE1DRAFT_106968 [Neurospora tetrasperma FGSC 2508]